MRTEFKFPTLCKARWPCVCLHPEATHMPAPQALGVSGRRSKHYWGSLATRLAQAQQETMLRKYEYSEE